MTHILVILATLMHYCVRQAKCYTWAENGFSYVTDKR